MKKIPVLVSILLIAGVLLSLAFTHPIQSVNGVVKSYSPGANLTVSTSHGDFTYVLRPATIMWGWGATSGVAVTGGSSSSSSNSSAASGTGTAAPAATASPAATATTTGGSSGSSSGGSASSSSTTGAAAATVNGLGAGARVTVFGQCFSGLFSTRGMNLSGMTAPSAPTGGKSGGNQNNANENKVCLALAVIVRSPMAGTIPATGSTSAPGATTATETPTVIMTPTP